MPENSVDSSLKAAPAGIASTSTDEGGSPSARATPAAEGGEGGGAVPMAGFVRPAAVAIVVVATLATGAVYDVGTAILVLAGGVLLLVVGLLWTSVRTLAGDTPLTVEQALELAAPSAAEEQKRAVLQALKDLEYERSVGKVSDADYKELLARYRAEAKRLLRAADEEMAPLRAKAEAFLESQTRAGAPRNRRVSNRPPAAAAEPEEQTARGAEPTAARAHASNGDAAAPQKGASTSPTTHDCASCQTPNDADAIFCKKCGARLDGAPPEPLASASADNANDRA